MEEILAILKPFAIGTSVIGAYIVASKYLTQFSMNGGKTPEQIIDNHRDDTNKRFLVKYPEADIRTGRHVLLALGFIFAFGSSIYAFTYSNKTSEIVSLEGMEVEIDAEVDVPPTEQLKPPPPPPPPPPEIEVVEDEEILEDEPEIEDTEIEEDEVVEVPEVAEEEEEVEEQAFFLVVEDMPAFKGCEGMKGDALDACTKKKIHQYSLKVDYPQIAIDNDIEGKVYISFIVGKDGSIKEVTLLRGVDKLLDNAALKHIRNMPKFAKPGKQRGKAVKVKYNIPIVFRLG